MKLQNNFTTPEQSKRLLELGVPANSADCYYDLMAEEDTPYWRHEKENVNLFSFSFIKPCWSVGRLIEIYEACTDNNCVWFDYKSDSMNLIERIIHDIISAKESINGIDFSKLEK